MPIERLDIEVAIGAAVRYANRTIKPATDQPIASCCEGAAAEIVLDALEATGFAIVRAPVHPTPTAAGPPIEAFSEYGQYSPITVGTGTATAADTLPACFENHHKYVGKCPYCHTELPPAADTGLVERLTDAEKDAHFWKANYNGFKAMAEAAEQREAAAREQIAGLERERDAEHIVAEYAEGANATLQADFNDCNSERARWKARAKSAEAALSSAQERIARMTEACAEIDRLFLVIESAVRFSDAGNYELVLAALKANRAALTLAKETNDGQ